jgi:ArsR family transcriptional regulator
MPRTDNRRIVELSHILKALGHPSRLFIVEEVGKEAHCVCELTALIGADTSTVSKHLSVLKNAGIVIDEKKGNQVYYSLVCPCVLESIKRLMPVIDKKHKALGEIMNQGCEA